MLKRKVFLIELVDVESPIRLTLSRGRMTPGDKKNPVCVVASLFLPCVGWEYVETIKELYLDKPYVRVFGEQLTALWGEWLSEASPPVRAKNIMFFADTWAEAFQAAEKYGLSALQIVQKLIGLSVDTLPCAEDMPKEIKRLAD